MPKGDKYIGLTNYLKDKLESIVVMSFRDIERQSGDELPPSSYKHEACWSNTRSHSVAFGWLNAGYKKVSADFNMQLVTFERE